MPLDHRRAGSPRKRSTSLSLRCERCVGPRAAPHPAGRRSPCRRAAPVATTRPSTSTTGEHAVGRDHVTVCSEHAVSVRPVQQQRVERAQHPHHRCARGVLAARQVDQSSGVVDVSPPTASRPRRASPTGMPAHLARSVAVAGPCPSRYRRASRANASSRSRGAGDRPSQCAGSTNACSAPTTGPRTTSPSRVAASRTWTSACPLVGTPASSSRSLSCSRVLSAPRTRPRAHVDATRRLGRADPLLPKTPAVTGGQLWGGERVQPPIVRPSHQLQRAAVEPADHQGSALGERGVDVRRAQTRRAGTDREPEAACVLSLNREQVPGHILGTHLCRTTQPLRTEARPPERGDSGRRTFRHPATVRVSRDKVHRRPRPGSPRAWIARTWGSAPSC